MLHIPGLFIAPSLDRDRGVYTSEDLAKGDLVEISPVIVIPKSEVKRIHKTTLHDYYFSWGKKMKKAAIALGYGSIYNHSSKPNLSYCLNLYDDSISFTATKKIKAGSELYIDYEAGVEGKSKLWFDEK